MKKFVLLVMCLLLIPCSTIAQGKNIYGDAIDNIQQPKKQLPQVETLDSENDVSRNDDFNPVTDAYYGSDESPAFNHTYGMNTHESDYGYGSF